MEYIIKSGDLEFIKNLKGDEKIHVLVSDMSEKALSWNDINTVMPHLNKGLVVLHEVPNHDAEMFTIGSLAVNEVTVVNIDFGSFTPANIKAMTWTAGKKPTKKPAIKKSPKVSKNPVGKTVTEKQETSVEKKIETKPVKKEASIPVKTPAKPVSSGKTETDKIKSKVEKVSEALAGKPKPAITWQEQYRLDQIARKKAEKENAEK